MSGTMLKPLALFWVLAVPSLAAEAEPILGCWQNELDEGDLVRFEPGKFTNLENGQVQYMEAKYAPGRVNLDFGNAYIEYEMEGGKLFLKGDGQSQAYRRLDKVPEILVLKPLAFAKKDPVPEERVKGIQADLARRLEKDQSVRKDPARAAEMAGVDADNTAWLTRLVGEIGWIDAKRFGRPASSAAFLIVQHSRDLPLMAAALPEIELDLKAGAGDPQDFALLYDRLQLRLGGRQRYGSQIGQDGKGNPVVLPLEDRARVEAFRKSIGLFPLADYLRIFAQQTGREVGFAD